MKIMGKLNKFKNQKGHGMVEFALSFVLFFAMFEACAAAAGVCYQWAILQFSVNQGARMGSLGFNTYTLYGKEITCERRAECVEKIARLTAEEFGVKAKVQVFDKEHKSILANPATDTNPEELMYVQGASLQKINLLASKTLIKYWIHAEALTRTEPFQEAASP